MTFFSSSSGPLIKIEFAFSEGKCIHTLLSLADKFEASLNGTLKNKELLSKWLEGYLNGQKHNPFPYPLDDTHFGPFQKKVTEALVAIPFGSFASYSEISTIIGSPRAARAVGNACGRNPYPLIVPCHRILHKRGSLGGFAFGLEMKRLLLDFEHIPGI